MSPLKSWGDLLKDAGDAGKTFELLPDGPYDFLVTEAKAGQSNSGLQRFTITATVESGPQAKRKLIHDFYVTPDKPAGLGFFFRNMAVLGLNDAYFAANPSEDQIAQALVGRRFIGVVGAEEWPKESGKKRNRIQNFQTPRGASGGPGAGPAGPSAGPTGLPPASAPVAASLPPAVTPTPAPVYEQPAPAIVQAAPAVVAPPVAAPVAPPVQEQPVIPAPTQPLDPWANAAGQASQAFGTAGGSSVPAPPPF